MLRLHGISRRDGGDLDGIHLLWSPPYPTGYCLDGVTIMRRRSEDQERFHCFDIDPIDFQRARDQGFTDIVDARVWASPTNQASPSTDPWTYRVELRDRYSLVQLNGADAICAFSAREEGTVIDGRMFVGTACQLTGGDIAIVWIIAKEPRSPIRICGDSADKGEWESARVLVRDLQVPFERVNPATPDLSEENRLAEERAQPEPLDGDFTEVSRYGNAAYSREFDTAAWRVTTHDPDAEREKWDATPLGFVLAVSAVVPAWRRALGFGFLDTINLTDGEIYDYRISGKVPRADRDEPRLDFHTVPRGQTLPSRFWLNDLGVLCDRPPIVIAEDTSADVPSTLWKGIRSERVWLLLPSATDRIAIDGHSDGPLDVTGFAGTAGVASLTVSVSGRTVLDFGTPVRYVLLKGPAFYAAFIPSPLARGLDPEEPVEVDDILRRVAYVPTSPPDPPTDLQAVNLGSATRAARRGQRDDTIGFEVSWLPPLRVDPGSLPWWPSDARTAPPTDVATYKLERTWDGQPFMPPRGTDGVQIASRNADPRTEALAPGANLLAVYPPANESGLAAEARVRAIDAFEEDAPKFGTDVTYGISSVDAIGRVSAQALAPPEPLEKRTRPPAPVAPPMPAPSTDPDDPIMPSGIQARLLQANDPDLSAAEQTLVATHGDHVRLSWGWGKEQRRLDPHVKEFRIYEAEGALAEVTATITAPPTALASGGWRLACAFSRPVYANEFTGVTVVLGLAYKIASHSGGSTGFVDLAPAEADGSRSPVGNIMTLIRTDGSEEDPENWDTRLQIEPRGAEPSDPEALERYEVILPASWITVSPSNRRQLRSFGVSAADRESYVDDRRIAVEPDPRSGNESPVALAQVMARYRGRPTLTIADLGPVASIALDRATAETVHLDFRPADYLPWGSSPLNPMRIERAPASVVLPRLVIDSGGISLKDNAGAEAPWTLSPADEAQLRTEAADRAISDRFLAHAAARITDLEAEFDKVADADPTRSVRDTLPNTPARWIYRLRALDAGGRASEAGQVLELVVHVPLPARAVLPELTDLVLSGGTATVTVNARASEGLLFLAHSNDSRVSVSRADLSSIRNRPDIAAADRFFVRDDRDQILTLTQVTPGTDGIATQTFSVPDGSHFHVWAFAVSPDDVPSQLVGPLHAFRGYPAENV